MSIKDSKNTIPPFDKPNYKDKSFDYYEWFKHHHLSTLEKYHLLIEKQYNNHPLGKGYQKKDITLFLNYLDELNKLYNWLPNTNGGTHTMDEVIEYRKKFEELYLNKDVNDSSFWLVQEIKLKVFTIYNYMEAMCED